MPVTVRLIDLVTKPDSVERFDELCHLLGEDIIGGIWVYATHEQPTIEASMSVVPILVHALGIGTVRYLKVQQSYFV